MALASVVFVVAALVSLATSWILITRLERVGERLGLSEALLGILAALAADTPEITSSISALTQHHRTISAGVVVGSNVFNLAALLGLGAVVSGFVALHRKVVVLGGFVAVWIALCCLATATGLFSTLEGFIPAALVLLAYLTILGIRRSELQRMPLPERWLAWLGSAVDDEELELADAVRPTKGRPVDALAACGALVVVVFSSVVMERSAVELGRHFHVSGVVIGGVVLAAVTSLPNAVAAVHLAGKGRGSAALSTALNSNNLNVVVGLFIPGTLIGLASPSATGEFTAAAYVTLTVLVLFLAFARRGLSRRAGGLIITGYAVFVAVLLIVP